VVVFVFEACLFQVLIGNVCQVQRLGAYMNKGQSTVYACVAREHVVSTKCHLLMAVSGSLVFIISILGSRCV